MIKSIEVKGFKAFNETQISFEKLNVLMGLNGSGKSTLIQVIELLLKKRKAVDTIRFEELSISEYNDLLNIDYDKQNIKIKAKVSTGDLEIELAKSRVNGILKYSKKGNYKCKYEYISPNRLIPQWLYSSCVNETELGINGENTLNYLELNGNNKTYFDDFSDFFQIKDKEINSINLYTESILQVISPGVKMYTQKIPETNMLNLKYKYDDSIERLNPMNIGFGITNILPVVVALLKANPNEIVILENPENNIHPKGQTVLGQLIAYVASKGVQVFVETHSDHILNGIRIAINKKIVNSSDAKVLYFSREKCKSTFSEISIDDNGGFSSMPNGFMDEWDSTLDVLLGFKS